MRDVRVPCVWVVASHRVLGNEHAKPQMYTVMDEAGTRTLLNMGLQPMTFPGVPAERIGALLEAVDGVFLGGSATHVHPSHYGEAEEAEVPCYDLDRDAVAQPLVREALARGIPLLGVCRGSHDMNVALGGSLHQSLRRRGGATTHWEHEDETLDEQYAPRHLVDVVPGGALERLVGKLQFSVSSLHSQGVNRLAEGLVPEAHSECGLVEAFRWHDPALFAWGFQFHPEWGWREHPEYGRIMQAFVDAVWGRHNARHARIELPPAYVAEAPGQGLEKTPA